MIETCRRIVPSRSTRIGIDLRLAGGTRRQEQPTHRLTKHASVPGPPRGRVPPDTPLGRRRRPRVPDLSGLTGEPSKRGRLYGDFLSPAERFIETPPSLFRTTLGYVLCGCVAAFLCWSVFGSLPLFAIAPGEVIAQAGTQAVESRVGGTVTAVSVRDGDRVARGAELVQLDATAAIADRAIVRSTIDDAKAEIARRTAAIAAVGVDPVAVGDTVTWADDIPASARAREDGILRADLTEVAASIADLASQRAAKLASRDRFTASIAAEKSLIEARTERTNMHQQLADKGWDSRARVLEALGPLRQEQVSLATLEGSLAEVEAAIPVLDRRIADVRQDFTTDNTQKRAMAQERLDQALQQLRQADRSVEELTLTAPVSGIVHALAVTTVGQAVKPGLQLLQIVPEDTSIRVNAYVLNTDIGFVRVGQPATIKVDSFPYTRYGTIQGRVTRIAPDAVPGRLALARQSNDATPETHGALSVTSAVQQTSDLVFPVEITPDRNWIAVGARNVPLLPGMSVAVEIETERQRAIAYVLYPLTRALPRH